MSMVVIRANGDSEAVHFDGPASNWDQIKRWIGCYTLQPLEFGDAEILFTDEESKCYGEPVFNKQATDLIAKYKPWFIGNGNTPESVLKKWSHFDWIAGDVVWCTGEDAAWFLPKNEEPSAEELEDFFRDEDESED